MAIFDDLEVYQSIGDNAWKTISLIVYPVGSVYISSNPQSPASTWGGTWQAYSTGRTLIGANSTYSVGSTGGAEKDSHYHWETVGADTVNMYMLKEKTTASNDSTCTIPSAISFTTNSTIKAMKQAVSSITSVNNIRQDATYKAEVSRMQPYTVNYIWIRTG